MTSAPKKYQKIVQDILQGCLVVTNIAHDLIINGKGIQKHDTNFFTVLERLEACGLTLNVINASFGFKIDLH